MSTHWRDFFMDRFIQIGCILFWFLVIVLFFYLPSFSLFNKTENSLNILTWPQIIDGEFLTEFEKTTGVRVNISYIESNEELLAKLRNNKDNHNYDLIMPSDFMLQTCIKEGFIKELDQSKILFWHDIQPNMLHNQADPFNKYTIPCFWTVFGIGVNLKFFNNNVPLSSWSLLFDNNQQHSVGMMENLLPIISVVGLYLFGNQGKMTKLQIDESLALLIEQKKRVVAYTESRIEFMLASGACAACFCSSADVAKIVKMFDNIKFLIPKEGTFSSLDAFALTSTTKKDEIIYSFLNYLYQPKIMAQYVEKFQFPSPLVSVDIPYSIDELTPYTSLTTPIYSFQQLFSPYDLEAAWIALRAA